MSPQNIVETLTEMSHRVDGQEKVALEGAVALLEKYDQQLKTFKRLASQQFRPSSEKVAPGQVAMSFIEHLAQQAAANKGDGNDDAGQKPRAEKPARPKRKSRLDVLPVKPVDRTLSEAERQCSCGACRESIGYDTRRQIMFEPSKLWMQEERLHKYACRSCSEGIAMPKGSPKLIDGSLASSSLLAHLTVAKVVDCTPIERIGKQLSRHGADVAPSTLYDWFSYAGREVELLQTHVNGALLQSQLISFDDTPMPAKNLSHPNNIQRGRIWLYLGDIDRIAFCQFSEDWKGKHPQGVLGGFGGELQSDGYGGVAALFHGTSPPNRAGCNDHGRRKFFEAMKLGDTRAAGFVELYAELYAVEKEATRIGASAQQRLDMRQRLSAPVWDRMRERASAMGPGVSPKGPLGKALGYWRKQEVALAAFLKHGHVPISNAHVERLLRAVALLRKNALFVGSLDAGARYAALLTMAVNCALCDANPFEYFTWLFDRLAEGVPAKRALDVMPQAWLRRSEAGQ
jgi:transposase